MPAVRGNIQTLAASAARTTSGNTGAINLSTLCGGEPDAAQFILNVTASSAPTTLDVYLQWSLDQGATFYDFGHFTGRSRKWSVRRNVSSYLVLGTHFRKTVTL
jgi:hypothetical protein